MEELREFNELIAKVTRSGTANVIWSGKQMGDSQLETLITAMELSPVPIEVLNISNNEITSAGAAMLYSFLKKTPGVKEIHIGGNMIDDAGAKKFISLFAQSNHPSAFDINDNKCSPTIVKNLALLAKGDQFTEKIREALLAGQAEILDVSGLDFNKLDPRLFTFFIKDTGSLKSLILSGCSTGDAGAAAIGDLLKGSTVNHVDLSDNDISDSGVSQFIDYANLLHCSAITSVSFSKNIRISNYGMQRISNMLFNVNDTITTFDVSDTSVTSSVRELIAHECELNKEPSCLKRAVVSIRTDDPSCNIVNLQWEGLSKKAARFIAPTLKHNTMMIELNLGNTSAGDRGVELLTTALQQNRTLRILGLANNGITSNGAKTLFTGLLQQGFLEELNLANNRIDDEAATTILNTLQLNPTIKVLNMINNFLSRDCMDQIEGLVFLNQAPKAIRTIVNDIENRPSSVTEIVLSGNTEEFFCNDASVRLLCHVLVMNQVVTSLDLSRNTVGDIGATYISEMLMTNSTIKEINLERNSITDRGAQRLCQAFRTNSSVQRLNLSDNALTDAGVTGFVDMLRYNYSLTSISLEKTGVSQATYTKITGAADLNKEAKVLKDVVYMLKSGDVKNPRLDLSRKNCTSMLDDRSVATLCSQLCGVPYVSELVLSGNNIGCEGCKSIGTLLSHDGSGIRHIDLSGNPIDDKGLYEISKGLLSANCVLESLNLSNTEVTSDGITELTEVLKENATLKEVWAPESVSSDSFCLMNQELMVNAQPQSLKPLLRSVKANEVIPSLIFRDPNCPFTDAACHLLCASIVNNEHITSLDMSRNKLTGDSAPYIAEALSRCPNIKEVDLSFNQFDEAGGQHLINCLSVNDNIKVLSVEGNSITSATVQKINELLHLNRGSIELKRILLNHRAGRITGPSINLNSKGKAYKLMDEDVRILCEVLMGSTSVRAIDLGMNMITDEGCQMLADVLYQSSCIQALYLDYNPIGAAGGEILYDVLKVNHHVHTLLLEGTNVPEEIWEEILSLLHVNKTPAHERIDMRNVRLEDVNDDTQFKSTSYTLSQEQKVGEDAFKRYEMSVRSLVRE
uniref:Uncharacterized protein TCIL3000_10_8740 n=1 Tax=Trypanosoma congolense (strain IL3000) TaxID=1068625 RepID=G0UXI1_TRYCI|nr:unnamed protein product [Trypanosoma congolense IL3000]